MCGGIEGVDEISRSFSHILKNYYGKCASNKGSRAPVVGFSYIVKNTTKLRWHLQCGGIKQRQNMTVWAKEKFKETPHDTPRPVLLLVPAARDA